MYISDGMPISAIADKNDASKDIEIGIQCMLPLAVRYSFVVVCLPL